MSFVLPQCPVPNEPSLYEKSYGVIREYHGFITYWLDGLQMPLGSEEAKEVFKSINNHQAADDPSLLVQYSTFVMAFVGFLVILGAILLDKLVKKARDGWKANLWKRFWFLSNRFFVLAQLAIYLLCLFVLVVLLVFFVLSIYHYTARLESLPEARKERTAYVEKNRELFANQTTCVHHEQLAGMFNHTNTRVMNHIDEIMNEWRISSGIEHLQKFDCEGLRVVMMEELGKSIDISSGLAQLRGKDISTAYAEKEIIQAEEAVKGIQLQLQSLTSQLKDLIPYIAGLLKDNEDLEKDAKLRIMIPAVNLISKLDEKYYAFAKRIETNSMGAATWFDWSKNIIESSDAYAKGKDWWHMYGGRVWMMSLTSFVLAFTVVIVFIVIGIIYSCQLLARNSKSTQVYGQKSQNMMFGGFYSIMICMVIYVVFLGCSTLIAMQLSRTCANLKGNNALDFYRQVRPDSNVASIKPNHWISWWYSKGYEEGMLGNSNQGRPEHIDFKEYFSELEDATSQVDWSIAVQSEFRLRLKATIAELTRNINRLNDLLISTGILPHSRQNSPAAELMATRISMFRMELEEKLSKANSLIGYLQQLEGPHIISHKTTQSNEIRENQDVEWQFNSLMASMEQSIEKMLPALVIQNTISSAGYALCDHVRKPYNGVWSAAMFSMPFMFLAALNVLATAKAISVSAADSRIKLLGCLNLARFYPRSQPLLYTEEIACDSQVLCDLASDHKPHEEDLGVPSWSDETKVLEY